MGSNCGYDFLMVFLWVGLDMVLGMVFCKKNINGNRKRNRKKKRKKNVRKIVNASKVPRIWFSAKNSRNVRCFYDFARVSLGKS